ncbi:LysR substrate-binding domain-containing protein [Chthonobacter rhizosphaerae]|uniref:LysR substrate-binding domain-containing protein n=1 Tax=Chthonobacter rhizosphaerae TaxID=2735553 RepID=UPI0015EE91A1|nr:LysR substrate-binding domain-containing protein [Chthonobacter rhizosphaerae]
MAPPPPFDLEVLRTFVAIIDTGSFTRAAGRVGLTQSSVSLQIRRLERGLGKALFSREGRTVHLTVEGELLADYARRMLRLGDEARERLRAEEVAGTVRLGTPEDFATVHLPDVLARFARAHPKVALEVNCDFTVHLLDGFAKGAYDLILFKREPQGRAEGLHVWEEILEWVASPRLAEPAGGPLPLVLAPQPDVYRRRAIAALDAAGLGWRIAFTSPSLAGLQAAVEAGLGITVLPREMVPPSFRRIGAAFGLPELPPTEIVLRHAAPTPSPAAARLGEHIVQSLEAARQAIAGPGTG